MPRPRTTLVALCLVALTWPAPAADPAPPPKTLMTERGKLLFADDLGQPPGTEWKTGKGQWEVVDGAVRATELKADMHAAVIRHAMPFQDVVIQYSFKLDGGRQTTLSINDARGHCCRVVLNASGLTVQKDSHDKNVADKSAVLERRAAALKPGEWHTVVVEIRGKEMLARVDEGPVAFGEHDAIDVKKSNFGLTVGGGSVSFKNLRVWEALPARDWATTKARLADERSKK